MFYLIKPSTAEIDAQLKAAAADNYSYAAVGATREPSPPEGFVVDYNRQFLGSGRQIFERAQQAIRDWRMFEVPGLKLYYPNTPIEPGQTVAPVAEHLGIYSINLCRIVYVIDEPARYGFAYGTLSQHAESGEERFTVEYDPDTDEVWYDIYAFSRPGHWFVRLGYPYSRYRQKQFAIGSKAAMLRAVNSTT
jgi:uncharacterized protein (UPF0548 family)